VYDKYALSSYHRLLGAPDLSDEIKAELYKRYNLVKLQKDVHKAVDALMTLNGKRELEGVKSLAASAIQAI